MNTGRDKEIHEQRLEQGVHFRDLITTKSTGSVERRAVLRAVSRLKIDDFLRNFPLGDIILSSEFLQVHVDGSRGWYDPFEHSLNLLTLWPPGSFGFEYDFPGTDLIAELGKTQLDVVRRGFVHELGHHIHTVLGAAVDRDIAAVFTEVAGRAVTKRARKSHREYFAESLAAYRYERKLLHRQDLDGYKLVERVLQQARERG